MSMSIFIQSATGSVFAEKKCSMRFAERCNRIKEKIKEKTLVVRNFELTRWSDGFIVTETYLVYIRISVNDNYRAIGWKTIELL